jgi:TonB-dependent SusC/RagA subfamily outer membrane receptor
MFPSGVLHFVLFDPNLSPVSERLVFINNPDQAQVEYRSDKEYYAPRSLVKNHVTIVDKDGRPVSGSFSATVTSDREVIPDSTSNILTQLLLTSDLRGHIENPAYYFQGKPESAWALDLLMCTQGWRRYNIMELAHGHFSEPSLPLELGSEVTGMVKGGVLGRAVKDFNVDIMSFTGGYLNTTQTDKEGRFRLPIAEFPDSTKFVVRIEPQRGLTGMELFLDREVFPDRTLSTVPPVKLDRRQLAKYADKAEQQYIYEGGIRITQLPAAVVSAERKAPRRSMYYAPLPPASSLTEEQLEKIPATNIYQVLNRLSGVQLSGKYVFIGTARTSTVSGATNPVNAVPLVLLNDMPMSFMIPSSTPDRPPSFILDDIDMHNVAHIDILKGPAAAIFGSRGANGVISIFTKDAGNIGSTSTPLFHIKTIIPLGYQASAEFYAPKYETTAQHSNPKPDLRTTIHWQPVVQTDSRGTTSFEFYTADEQASYTVIIEGLTDDGTIIRQTAIIAIN